MHDILLVKLDRLLALPRRAHHCADAAQVATAKHGAPLVQRRPRRTHVRHARGARRRHWRVPQLMALQAGERVTSLSRKRRRIAPPPATPHAPFTAHAHPTRTPRADDAADHAKRAAERIDARVLHSGDALLVHTLRLALRSLEKDRRAAVEPELRRVDLGELEDRDPEADHEEAHHERDDLRRRRAQALEEHDRREHREERDCACEGRGRERVSNGRARGPSRMGETHRSRSKSG